MTYLTERISDALANVLEMEDLDTSLGICDTSEDGLEIKRNILDEAELALGALQSLIDDLRTEFAEASS